MSDPRWYAVMTGPMKERLATRALLALGIDVFWPHYVCAVRHGTRRGYSLRPWFPRYLFVAEGPSFSAHAVNTAMGVSSLVFIGERPLVIPSGLIWDLKSMADPRGCIPGSSAKSRPKNMVNVKGANIIAALEELRDLKRKVWATGIAATARVA